jgi:MFS family permease
VTILTIGVIQLFKPFLTYYGVWIVFLFLVGACVGGGVTNTNYKIARDFQRAGEPDEVRSFAMSFAGLGNFGGDAIGGALATMVQQLALQHLKPRA